MAALLLPLRLLAILVGALLFGVAFLLHLIFGLPSAVGRSRTPLETRVLTDRQQNLAAGRF